MAARLKTIEDSSIVAMASNAKFVQAFPFLKRINAAHRKSGCSKCQRGHKDERQVIQQAKATIAGMGPTQKKLLKQLLNTDQVRVIYQQPNGKTIRLTF